MQELARGVAGVIDDIERLNFVQRAATRNAPPVLTVATAVVAIQKSSTGNVLLTEEGRHHERALGS
jgi:hypothetical protein